MRPRPGEETKRRLLAGALGAACGLSPLLSAWYERSVWGPVALVLLALLVGLVIAGAPRPRASALAAIGGLAALAAWALLSSGWAESGPAAIEAGARWVLYAALLACLVLIIRRMSVGEALLIGVGAVISGLALVLAALMVVGDGPSLFLSGRLHEPIGFINGMAALFTMGLWPAVAAAERIENRARSSVALSAVVLLLSLTVLTQTRAALPAVALAAALLLIVLPGRARRGAVLLAGVAAVALALPWLLDVYDGSEPSTQIPSDDSVRAAGLAALAVAAAAGLVWFAALGLVARTGAETRARVAAVVAWACAALALVGVVGAFAAADPIGRIGDEIDAFTELESDDGDGGSRLVTAGGNRYDYWRIAVLQFEDEPIRGVGAGNYSDTYFIERRTDENVTQPHSLELQVLAELGLVGALALLVFAGGLVAGLAGSVRRYASDPAARAVIVAGGGMAGVWIAQGAVDWHHLLPGVTAIALCGAATLVAPPDANREPARGGLALGVAIAVCLAVLFCAFTLGRLVLAEHERSVATDLLEEDPREALDHAEDALRLEHDSLDSLYVQAAALARLNQYEPARLTLLGAARLEPNDYVPWALLGDLASRRGDLTEARRDYARASDLNPRDEELRELVVDPG